MAEAGGADSRPDSRESQKEVAGAVTDVTVRALREVDFGEGPAEDSATLPGQSTTPVRPISGRAESRPSSSRRSRPQSGVLTGEPLEVQGSRPGTGENRPTSATRPGSARLGSAARPASGRPGSGRPTSGRAKSGKSGSAGSRRSVAERIQESAADVEGSVINSVHDDGMDDEERPPGTGYTGPVPPPTQAPGENTGALIEAGDTEANDGDIPVDDYAPSAGSEVENVEEEEEGESEEDADLVVLDPDHPLMKRFQAALNKQLSGQHGKIALELSELSEALKRKMTEREAIGVELYGVQQELARYQVMLESHHDNYNDVNQNRTVKEQILQSIRNEYRQLQQIQNQERKKAAELQQEVENLALRLFYVSNAKEDVQSDISVMKRAAERADQDVSAAEAVKQKQDLYVNRLVERVDRLREDIAITEAQITAQLEETKSAKEALNEANAEIETIQLEKKHLYAQWNSSLIGMKRRDEAHAAMQEANDQQRQRIKALETELEGYKKMIAREEEKNEKLTLVLNKCEVDIATSQKLLDICGRKMEALKKEYSAYTRMLHESEEALNLVNAEKIQRNADINSLRKMTEKEYLEKVRLDDEILEIIRSQLTFDKAAQYTERMTRLTRQHTKDLDAQMAVVENEIATDSLNTVTTKAGVAQLRNNLDQLEEVIKQKNDIITKSDNETIKRNAIIERKQQIIDQFNKKLEQMISQAGGVELGPLEITINSLSKSIESTQQEIAQLQLMWLREQGELVGLSKESDQRHNDVNMLKKKISILSQKKIRIENSIDGENRQTQEIRKHIQDLRNDMLKLNDMIYKENGAQNMLERENLLAESDFVGKLKDAELESIEMQSKLEGLKEEKERLLNSLVESERQIMLWEKKTQLARETRAAVDSEVGQGEIAAMRSEIHRMEVRYSQLMRQQEKMIQDMEKAVSRRDTIVTRGDAQTKIAARTKTKDKTVTKGSFQRQLAEMRKKVKTTIQDAQTCDGELQRLRNDQQNLGSLLEEKQITCREMEGHADTMDGDIERQNELKQRNMIELVAKQQKTKYYQQLKERKYKRMVKDDAMLDVEREKQIDRMQSLNNIVDRLQEEFPHLQTSLRKVSVMLGTRITQESQTARSDTTA